MAVLLEMPRLSDTMREGTIQTWVKSVGDTVRSGDVLAEIETDKAVMEYEAADDGILRAILVPAGSSVEVGAPMAIVADEDEDIAELLARAASVPSLGAAAPAALPAPAISPPPPAAVAASKAPAAPPPPTPTSMPGPAHAAARAEGAHLISPLAARLAAEHNVDLASVRGSGPGGRIVKADVLAAQTRRREIAAPAALTGFSPPGSEHEDTAASQMRRTIAERLIESKASAPHFYLTMSIDMEALMALRQQINASQDRVKVSVNDLVVKAAALASRQVPAANAAWVDAEHPPKMRHYRDVHVGVAVALEDGLVTPVLRHVDRRSLVDVALETRDLTEKARARRLQPEAYQGNTLTVSNLGMFGIESFTAIINPPASLILAVGAAQDIPVVKDGQVAIAMRMKVTLSCDHRVVDGALGARWLNAFKAAMENPLTILAGA